MKILLLLLLILLIYLPVYSQSISSLDYLNRILSETDTEIQKSIARLSSGVFLLTDDPAAAAIFEALEGHIRGLAAYIRNTEDLISYYRTKEGFITNIIDTLQRIRELIIRMSGGIMGPFEQEIIRNEIDHHYDSIIKTLTWAEFNTNPMFPDLFDNENIMQWFKTPRFYLMSSVDNMLNFFIFLRSEIGATVNALESRTTQLSIEKLNAEDYESTGDTDYAFEISRLRRNQIIFLSNIFLLKTQ